MAVAVTLCLTTWCVVRQPNTMCGLTVFVVVMVVSTRRGTLVFATTLVVLEYPDLHTINDVLYLSYRKAVRQTESLKPHGARHCPART